MSTQTPLEHVSPDREKDDIVVVLEPDTTRFNKQARTGTIVLHSQNRERLEMPSTIDRALKYAEQEGLKEPGISSRQAPYPFTNPTTGTMDGFRLDIAVMGR